ncbi:Ig-like domain repeat protein [Methanobrevibacter sp. V74]|uniref:Ig-like domain repeat protein n=1 Tax=Methanobrevibacter sp. V74 TaxID=3064279 RepID=UPI0027343A34|nr:Ig-like domain repeat protein [Methanobrevibacter sp. V74]
MDKLIVDVKKIRGLGNIVSPKSFSDFIGYQSIISESEETVGLVTSQVFNVLPVKTKANTVLSINVPLSLVYSDEFNITGTLHNEENTPISNVNIKLKVGDTVVDTQITNTEGVVTFTQTPVNLGTHSFQLVFDGNDNYENSVSSEITRDINKETSVLNINSPANNQIYYSGDVVNVSGVLTSDDGEPLIHQNISLRNNNEVLASITTGNDGSFSTTLTGLNVGQYSLNIHYEDNYYTSSDAHINFSVLEGSLTLTKTAGKQILYYPNISNGEEYCTLTATLFTSDNVNKPITFKQGNTILTTVNTDNEGKATYTYNSQGIGDATITAEYMNLHGTYIIEDYLFKPALDGTTGAKYCHSYNEANGESVGKGFIINGGFPNIEKWELSFEFRHDNIRYTGIILLADVNSSYNGGGGGGTNALTTWEGSFPGTSAYAGPYDGAIDWFDIKITKIDETHARIESVKLNKNATVELVNLPNWQQISCGARHNTTSQYGPSRIRNIIAKRILE